MDPVRNSRISLTEAVRKLSLPNVSSTPSNQQREQVVTAALYVAVIVIWGASWFAIAMNLGTVESQASVTYRFGLSAILVVLICIARGDRLKLTAQEHFWTICQGSLMFGLNYVLFYRATENMPSGMVAIVYATIVIMNTLLTAAAEKSKPEMKVLLGGALGVAGVTLIFLPRIIESGESFALALGLVLTLAGTFVSSVSQIIAQVSLRKKGMPLFTNMAYALCYGAAITGFVSALTGTQFTIDSSLRYLGSLSFLVVFSTIAGFALYLELVRRIGAPRVAYASILYPIVALLLSTTFESFQWSALTVAGIALALLGNLVVLKRPSSDNKRIKR